MSRIIGLSSILDFTKEVNEVADIAKLMQDEKVTFSAGVPTVWLGMLDVADDYDLSLVGPLPQGLPSFLPALSAGNMRKSHGAPPATTI